MRLFLNHPTNTQHLFSTILTMPLALESLLSLVSRKILNPSIHQSKLTNYTRTSVARLHVTTVIRSERNASKNGDGNYVTVIFKKPDEKKVIVKASVGKSLYDAVIDNNVDIDGFGACEGTLCCTTCHLIFKQDDYEKVGKPSDEELDMLDLAYGLTDTSRLGCQVILKKEFDPLEVQVPAGINDIREC